LHGTIGTVNRTLNGLHGTIWMENGTLNGLYRTIRMVNGTLNGLHGTIRTENGTLDGLHGTIRTGNGFMNLHFGNSRCLLLSLLLFIYLFTYIKIFLCWIINMHCLCFKRNVSWLFQVLFWYKLYSVFTAAVFYFFQQVY
jgi:hypothetical protein